MHFLIALIIIRSAFVFSIPLNGDDLLFSYSSLDALLSEHAMQLLIVAAFATWVAGFLGGLVPFQTSFWSASVLASMAIFSLALRHYWAPKSSTFFALTVGLLFGLLPYHTDIQLFGIANPTLVFCYLIGSVGIALAGREGLQSVISIFAISLALGYQTFASIFISAGLVKTVLLVHSSLSGNGKLFHDALRPSILYFLRLVAACFVYMAFPVCPQNCYFCQYLTEQHLLLPPKNLFKMLYSCSEM